jgi:hypothetical protein
LRSSFVGEQGDQMLLRKVAQWPPKVAQNVVQPILCLMLYIFFSGNNIARIKNQWLRVKKRLTVKNSPNLVARLGAHLKK